MRIEISWGSIFRVMSGVLLAYLAIRLWPIFKLLTLSVVIAVALYPIVRWVLRKGWPRWVGLLLATVALLVLIVGCFAVIAPILGQQLSALVENLPRLREQILKQLPNSGILHQVLERGVGPETVADSRLVLQHLLIVAETTLGGLVYLVLVVALAIYLMADGPRALKWLIVFFPMSERGKISLALGQMSQLISSYVTGQFLVSVFATVYLFIVLELLGVPLALLMGIVAGLCDVVPVIGFITAVALAMAMGLTVSPVAAVLIFVLYGAYHLFENFYIIPRVYGKKLKLSKLAVPLAMAAGGMLAGVVGVIAVLPLVAVYPVVERLWLAPKLAPDTVKEHELETP